MEKIMSVVDSAFFRTEIGSAYYVFALHNKELDFGQNLYYWRDGLYERIAKAIIGSENFRIKNVVFCGTYTKYNDELEIHESLCAEKLVFTETFSDMSKEDIDRVKKLITEVAPRAVEILKREEVVKKETWRVGKLLDDYRYSDAKEHCRIFELSYDSIIFNRLRR